MTISITLDRPHFTRGRLRAWARRKLSAVAAAVAKPRTGALANITRMPLTVAGLSCFSSAAFMTSWHVALGLVVTGAAALYLEFAAADE